MFLDVTKEGRDEGPMTPRTARCAGRGPAPEAEMSGLARFGRAAARRLEAQRIRIGCAWRDYVHPALWCCVRRDRVEVTELLSVSDRQKDIYLQAVAAVSAGDGSALDALLASGMVDHNPMPGQPAGRAGFKAWMAAARSSFPDFSCTVETVLSEQDLVAGHIIWRGTHRGASLDLPATNKAVAVHAFHIVRINSGLIVDWWGNADLLAAVQQLGGQIVLPPAPHDTSEPIDWFG